MRSSRIKSGGGLVHQLQSFCRQAGPKDLVTFSAEMIPDQFLDRFVVFYKQYCFFPHGRERWGLLNLNPLQIVIDTASLAEQTLQ